MSHESRLASPLIAESSLRHHPQATISDLGIYYVMMEQGSSSSLDRGEKRAKYVAKACQQCRRRKVKCDGRTPQCSRCAQVHDQCSYGPGTDKRRSNTMSYVRTLENRIRVLEDLLATTAVSVGRSDDVDLRANGSSGSDDADWEEESLFEGMATLTLDAETRELKQYGPTSALQSLPSETREDPTNLGILSPHYNPWTRTMSALPRRLDGSDIDWRRHLPPLEDWDRELHETLIDLFFDCFCFYQIVDELAFRNDLISCLSFSPDHPAGDRTSHYSPVLHNAMLAVACELSDEPRAAKEEVGATLLRAAQHELFVEGERPTLSTVQGVLLIGHYFTCVGKHGLGYFYTGIATRMCHTLGLGVDCSTYIAKGLLSKSNQQARDRTFWVCFLYDKLWSSYIGHEPSLPSRRSHVPLPEPTANVIALNHVRVTPLGPRDETSPPSGTFAWTCKLAVLHEQVMSASYGPTRRDLRSPTVMNRVSSVGLELDKWFESLPDNLRVMPQTVKPPAPHILTVNLYFHFLITLLYRPYYLGAWANDEILDQTATLRCHSSTLRILSLLELFDAQPGLRYAPVILIQFATMSCTTIWSRQKRARELGRPDPSSDATHAALQIFSLVGKLGRPYRASTQHVGMLDNLRSKLMASRPTHARSNQVGPTTHSYSISVETQIQNDDTGLLDVVGQGQGALDFPMFDLSMFQTAENAGLFSQASNTNLLQQPAVDSFFEQWGLKEIFGVDPAFPGET